MMTTNGTMPRGRHAWGRRGLAGLSLTLTLTLPLLLAACGGGGGSGGDAPAAPVTVGAPTPADVSGTVIQGSTLPPLRLSGALTGPVESLDGRPVYVVVEDPAALYTSTALLAVERLTTGWRWSLDLTGRTLVATGRRTGTLRLRACLDPACATALAGTPLSVPYDVNVVAPLVLSTNRIERSAAFGTQPANVAVSVTIPSVSRAWAARNTTPFSGNPQRVIVNPRGPFSAMGGWLQDIENALDYNTAAQFEVQFAPAPPGVYRETIAVVVETVSPLGALEYASRSIEVVYTVTDTPGLRHQFLPTVVAATRRASDPQIMRVDSVLVTSTGVTATLLGVDYLEQPAGATSGPLTSWVNLFPNLQIYHCIGLGNPTTYDCLAPGTYRAQLRYQMADTAGAEIVTLPVVLTVTP